MNVEAVQERLGISAPVIGSLTTASEVEPGAPHALTGATRPGVEPEVAIVLSRDVSGGGLDEARTAIGALAPAIEVVDVDLPFDDLESILAANVFHRAVVLGAERPPGDLAPGQAMVTRGGGEQASGDLPSENELAVTVRLVADLLAEAGEVLRAGEVIIAGSLTPIVWVEPGDQVKARIGALGEVEIHFGPGEG